MKAKTKTSTATKNACKLCTPLGAALAFKGVKNCLSIMHGSQGCSTYIRRYLISHFKEPVDIASSNFSENTAIFGGGANLHLAIDNVVTQYKPDVIGIATTCLSETIGDDMNLILNEYRYKKGELKSKIVHVSTPSYRGTHMDGFHAAVYELINTLAEEGPSINKINILPGMVSPADIRYLKEVLEDFGISGIILPDYSDTLDGGTWTEYKKIPPGGTSIEEIKESGRALLSIQFGRILHEENNTGKLLERDFHVPYEGIGMPIGIKETDIFFKLLEKAAGKTTPEKHKKERDRLIDAYADGHKYVFGKKALIYGEEDFVVAMASFLSEIGVRPAVIGSGGKSGFLSRKIKEVLPEHIFEETLIIDGADFKDIEEAAENNSIDLMIGHSKGYKVTRKLNIPLLRVGFPVHDRFGAQRLLHLGYRGAQQLFDMIVNSIIQGRQDSSPVGYMYI